MHLLFVDDEQRILEGIRRELMTIDREWDLDFAQSGAEALRCLAHSPADALISDMRMPEMDGAQLLRTVADRHPEVLRVVLSGHCEQEAVLRSITLAHRYLTKPSTASDLEHTIDSAFRLRSVMTNPQIIATITSLGQLPILPSIFIAIDQELSSPSSSISRIADLITQDIGLTAKLLQLVNSAFFAKVRTIDSISEAVTYLGLDTIRALVVALELAKHANRLPESGFHHADYVTRSLVTARLARHICRTMRCDSIISGHAFIAAMLHDVGQLILAAHCPELYRECTHQSVERSCEVWQIEQERFGTSHGFIGAYLLSLWGLSDHIVSAVAYHHQPWDAGSSKVDALLAVYVADRLTSGCDPRVLRDDPLLSKHGMSPHILGWSRVASTYSVS